MADLLDLTVAEAAARSTRARSPPTSTAPPGRRRRRRRPQRLPLAADAAPNPTGPATARAPRRGRATPTAPTPAPAESGPLAGVPVAIKDIFCTEGIPTTAGSKILEGYRPPYTATAVRTADRGRAPDPRQDQHGRVRDGLVERELRLRPGAATPGTAARPRRLLGRLGGGRRRRPRPVGARHRHRRLDPPARRALRHRRPEADLRRDLALRDDRLRLLARPVRPAHPRRHRRGAAARRRCRATTRCDSTSVGIEGGDRRCPTARTSRACASASRASSARRARPRRPRRLRARPWR